MYTVISMNFRGGNDCCVVLKSEIEFCAFADLPTPFITLRGYNCDVIEQQVNFLMKATAATKGINKYYSLNHSSSYMYMV